MPKEYNVVFSIHYRLEAENVEQAEENARAYLQDQMSMDDFWETCATESEDISEG
jgi:hypothetical protein